MTLNSQIQYLKSIGPKRAEILSSIGIQTVHNLLYYFPSRYLDRTTILNSSKTFKLVASGYNSDITIIGKVVESEEIRYGKTNIYKVSFKDDKGFFECVWFKGIKYFRNRFKEGDYYAISAKPVITKYGHLQFAHPDFDKLASEESLDFLNTGKIIPFYKISAQLKNINLGDLSLRRLISSAVEQCIDDISETLPQEIISANNLLNLKSTIINKHFPESSGILDRANYRLKFEEFFYIESLIALKKKTNKTRKNGISFKLDIPLVKQFLNSLEFELTNAQLKTLHDIRLDMENKVPMNRLIQGDVGSGKTIVALIALLIAVSNNKQAAFMAPTEILAIQHFHNLQAMLTDFPITVQLLIGGQKLKEKNLVYDKMKSGFPAIYVGTHALIEEKANFSNLGLVIIDEQHRFGVAQRSKLITKSLSPDVLVMTATPIPRTLTMTVYGDLDVSIIDEMPKNRIPIKTFLRSDKNLDKIYKFIIESVKKGQQAFIVYPLVEDSDKLDLKAAESYFEELNSSIFRDYNVGLIHGKMKWDEKKEVMDKFAKKEFDILFSTTVIEVGIDIPNANIMVINDAHRFGLSQLHQLRGRIGRGAEQGFCILVTSDELSKRQFDATFNFDYLSDAQIQKNKTIIRLNALVAHKSGFRLAEIDMKLRGPGDIYGLKQSGLPDFKYANLVEDQDILFKAKNTAFELIEDDHNLIKEDNNVIKENLKKFYKDNLHFSNIA
ncbi:MAG: ATP-dependent DNA helicase RecG [Bacteroidetes bacterium]|nr:ATP-dependent DNA helicase RecG [Bacteroidota bacterium]MBU1114839.1 ATP-dependent DNA helicase RecG [Bacteroidota bacterium]MBU1799986.1 ATP-dependent DNA helicase RecG [Bacteroidota bacterium]